LTRVSQTSCGFQLHGAFVARQFGVDALPLELTRRRDAVPRHGHMCQQVDRQLVLGLGRPIEEGTINDFGW